ncbi:uroporphyrinogen decarboxylase family protein, partial [Micromonospora echinofusca]
SVQGNLDPCVLFAPWEVVETEVRRVLAQGRAAPGHIFNLGHGVLPETDPDVLTRVVALVHEVSARPDGDRSHQDGRQRQQDSSKG